MKSRLIGFLTVSMMGSAGLVSGQTTSPFTPPTEKLGVYVINSGAGLDTGCSFRSDGPLVVTMVVPATVNAAEVNPDGTLKDPSKLIQEGVLASTVRVRYPVYDVDSGAVTDGTYAPEIDHVSFNGQYQKDLTGLNNTWTDDSLTIPIGQIKFKSTNSPGATNELRVDIDQGNIGNGEYWCTALDWVSVEFDTAAPYVLFHGINADLSTWDEAGSPGVITTLNRYGVLWMRFTTGRNDRSAANAMDLMGQVTTFLKPVKSDKVNIIVHSKGGLDAQMLQALNPPFTILSLSSFSTPHLGSVVADLTLIAKAGADDLTASGADPNGYASTYINSWTFGAGPQLPGLQDLATSEASSALSLHLRGNIQPTYTMGADADLNGDGTLETNESAGLFPVPFLTNYAAQRAWNAMRTFSSAPVLSLKVVPGKYFGTRTVLTYQLNVGGPFANDIVVTELSANPSFGQSKGNFLANHSTIKTGDRVETFLKETIPLH